MHVGTCLKPQHHRRGENRRTGGSKSASARNLPAWHETVSVIRLPFPGTDNGGTYLQNKNTGRYTKRYGFNKLQTHLRRKHSLQRAIFHCCPVCCTGQLTPRSQSTEWSRTHPEAFEAHSTTDESELAPCGRPHICTARE